ncbi:DUF1376 domain-containing protein [Gemmobacter sp. 24YEA27]|uniref:DUF1376 domain-containing protein n=1 Tax=Gemmobacter sp. 24YEA27 TaxID=3040672 RepID=UPI0024B3C53B|nr:DUF1376 domain-containing protein [Gemmobacter sp. 24YEA27]
MSEGAIPWFRFYPADFMHGVRGMSATEVGLYQMLLCRIYEENGPVEYSPLRLSTYAGMREATFLKTFEKLVALGKLTLIDGMVSNARAEIEISNRADDLKNSSKAGKASAQKRQQKQRQEATPVQQAFNHTDTDTDTDTEDGGGDARARDDHPDASQQDLTFRERILVACGVSTSGFTGRGGQMIGRSGEIAEINARMTERRISEAEVLQIVSEEMAAKNAGRDPGPPSSLRFFLSALDRLLSQAEGIAVGEPAERGQSQ